VVLVLYAPMQDTKQVALKYKNNTLLVQSVTDLIVATEEFLTFRYPRCEQQWIVSYNKISDLVKIDPRYVQILNPKLKELLSWFERIKRIKIDKTSLPEQISIQSILESRLSTNIRLNARSILTQILTDSQVISSTNFKLTNWAFSLTIACLAILILIFIVNAFFLIRNVLPPLGELSKKARRIMDGDLNQNLKPGQEGSKIRTYDEIGELAMVFDSMTQQLVRSVSDLEDEVKERKLSEARFRAIYEQSPIAIEIYNKHGKLADVNQKTLDLFGVEDKNYVLGFDLWTDPNIPAKDIEQLQKGQSIFVSSEFDFDLVKSKNLYPTSRSGKIYWDLFAIPILKQEEIDGYLLQVLEVTEQKKAEQDLRESEEKYRSMMMSMTDAAYICSPEFRIEYMNPAMIRRIGRDAVGEICHNAIYDKDEKCAWCTFDSLGKRRHIEYELLDPKTNRDYSVTSSPIAHPDGTLSKLTVFRDITEIKRMEESLRQSQKMESIGTLAGGIAHDFNNILGIIVGNTELALDDVPKWNSAHSSLEEIKTASLRAKNIVKQLLSFSRKTDQKLQPIQIASVIKDALKFLRSTIPTTINIHRDIQTTEEMILADPTQINQIIMNLCINASHAMEQTGGDLIVNVERVILDYQLFKDYPDLKSGDHVKIMVSDTGPGIDPEIIDQIFDPYFTTKEVGKGSGMGLAVVHGIVKNYNGAISVDSSQGKGTKFSILFPLTSEKPEIEAQTNKDIPRGNETILFVDDEISITKMVKRMFERLGYKVETATTPQDALERFSLNPDHFDLVITDMTMPQMTGVKLSEKLMEIRPDIPIIICTGHSALVDEERAKDLNLAAYVMKPIDMQETAQTIRKVLDKK